MVELVDGETRRRRWPANDFLVVRTDGAHDLVVLNGVEPHLAWPLYVAAPGGRRRARLRGRRHRRGDRRRHPAHPHAAGRRQHRGPELARRLALSAPTYQGITGLIGVLHIALERAGVPTISLRVGVPHYLGHMEHPLAVAALVRHLAHVLGLPLVVDVADAAERWAAQHARPSPTRPAAGLRPHARGRVRPTRRGRRWQRRRHRRPLRGVPPRPPDDD